MNCFAFGAFALINSLEDALEREDGLSVGTLFYGPQEFAITIDDRELSHLKQVVIAKLRRGESFMFSWDVPPAEGNGRQSIWLHPTIPVRFRFDGNRQPTLNHAWIDQMMVGANSPGGLRRGTPEPEPTP